MKVVLVLNTLLSIRYLYKTQIYCDKKSVYLYPLHKLKLNTKIKESYEF